MKAVSQIILVAFFVLAGTTAWATVLDFSFTENPFPVAGYLGDMATWMMSSTLATAVPVTPRYWVLPPAIRTLTGSCTASIWPGPAPQPSRR